MYLADYHIHSQYSFDGNHSIPSLCESAIRCGLSEIAITDHLDIHSIHSYEKAMDCQRLYAELDKCKSVYGRQLVIRSGVELGQPMVNEKEYKRFMKDYPHLDFIIGSVHNMENDIDVADYDFNICDPQSVYDHYLDYLLCMAENYDFDVLGHVTYPLRYMAKAGKSVDVSRFMDKIEELYKIVIGRGKGIELNVSGLRQEMKDTMPSEKLLLLYKDCGGEILTIGSDAHYFEHVGAGIREGQMMAEKCGFRYLALYEKRVPVMKRL